MKGQIIGELAKNAEVNIETIRYYERLGLIPEPPRTESGYRVFPPEVIQRIRFIKRSQDLGFTLAEIQELLASTESEGCICGQVSKIASQKLEKVETKIRDLENIKSVLQDLLSKCGEGPIDACPILDKLQEYDFL